MEKRDNMSDRQIRASQPPTTPPPPTLNPEENEKQEKQEEKGEALQESTPVTRARALLSILEQKGAATLAEIREVLSVLQGSK